MPTYEYECKDCGHEFEVRQRITEDPLDTCPECSGSVRRLVSAGAGIIFKGSGFYTTDYRSENYKKRAKEEKSSSDSSKSSASSSSSKDSSSSSTSKDSSSSSSSKSESSGSSTD